MVIAYLRVSTEKQFLANQKEEIMRQVVHRDRKRKRDHKRQKVIRVIEENASRGYTDCNGDFEIEPYTARDYDYPEFLY